MHRSRLVIRFAVDVGRPLLLTASLFLGLSPVFSQTNVRVSAPSANQPEEVAIAINPLNPAILTAGSNLIYTYRSSDGGATWTTGSLSSVYGVWGDPSVAFDAKGNLYYAHLSRPPADSGYFIDRIVVQKSTDNGLTWTRGTGIGYNPPKQQDKEWIAVDLTPSPYHDNLYLAWTQFDKYGSSAPTDSSRILFSRSTDAGTSWSTPVRVSDQAGDCLDSDSTDEGAVPAVGPNGEVYLAWAGPLGIVFDKSTDGGVTWGKDRFVAAMPGGWDFDVSGIFRANGLPITACDVSNGPNRGTVYVGWSDQRNGPRNTDVFLARSTDGGGTWSPPLKVNDDSTARDQFFTWMTVDQSTGALWFDFYDRRKTTGDATDLWCALSTDGGKTFKNIRVSETSFTPVKTVFFGDYTSIAAQGGYAYPVWMRMDQGALSVWTARLSESGATAVAGLLPPPQRYLLEQNYPNPFNPATTISYEVPAQATVSLKVFDLLGREVATLVDGQAVPPGRYSVDLDDRYLASGTYFYRLEALPVSSAPLAPPFVRVRSMIVVK
ncbi:MAG TPA: T9SS type A sorting domain-containing protein [Bacteroidota bacterium]